MASFFPPDFRYTMVTRRAAYTPDGQYKADQTYRSGFGLTRDGDGAQRKRPCRISHGNDGLSGYPHVAYTLDSYWRRI